MVVLYIRDREFPTRLRDLLFWQGRLVRLHRVRFRRPVKIGALDNLECHVDNIEHVHWAVDGMLSHTKS